MVVRRGGVVSYDVSLFMTHSASNAPRSLATWFSQLWYVYIHLSALLNVSEVVCV